jgi:uncharacterized protein (TIGR02594 family)
MRSLNASLISKALKEYDVTEIAGPRHRSRVQQFLRVVGFGKTDETPWCSAFMAWLFLAVTGKRVGKANARSWETVEEPFNVLNIGSVRDAEPGDVVVLWRGSPKSWKGHVGLFVRATSSRIWLLGGNQNGKVCVKRYPINRVIAVRRFRDPTGPQDLHSPRPVDTV